MTDSECKVLAAAVDGLIRCVQSFEMHFTRERTINYSLKDEPQHNADPAQPDPDMKEALGAGGVSAAAIKEMP